MSLKTKAGVAAATAGILAGLPGAAGAAAPKGLDGHRGHFAGLPSRVSTKLKRVEKALDRAQERADDGNDAGAASQLTAARRALASAQKSAVAQTAAGKDAAPVVDEAVAFVEHDVVVAGVDLLDGASGSLTSASLLTMGAALDGRDGVLAAIAALDADAQGDFADAAGAVVDDTADEVDTLSSSLSEDELTGDASAALTTARTQVVATGVAALALSGDDSADDAEADDSADAAGDRPCPAHGGQAGGSQGGTYPGGTQTGTYPGGTQAASSTATGAGRSVGRRG